jgi:tetratricopeptide (TPR) repeat protein
MLGFAWLTLRQAQEALRNGRLEDAHRLLSDAAAQDHKGSWELFQQLAQGFVQRGERHLQADDVEAAWNDLLHAEQVGAAETSAGKLRQVLVRQGLSQVRALVQAGEPGRALEAASQLRDRSVHASELQLLEEAARHWSLAREHAGRGEFAQAIRSVDQARRAFQEPVAALDQFRGELEQRQQAFAAQLGQLHTAVEQARWRDVLDLAEKVLAAAPQHAEARKARGRAWKAIEPVTVADCSPRLAIAPPAEMPQRFLLWIDGVGGYLVCLGTKITLGQATADAFVDVPLFADISREHAALTRDAEGYLLEGLRPVQINGRPVSRALLHNNDRVTLGNSCQFQFRQSVPASTSSRLDLVSGHRLPLSLDAVILMSDTLVLGPGEHVHVCLPERKQNVVLYRHKDGLGIRYGGTFHVDGHACKDKAMLGPSSAVAGEDFGFALEQVGPRWLRV